MRYRTTAVTLLFLAAAPALAQEKAQPPAADKPAAPAKPDAPAAPAPATIGKPLDYFETTDLTTVATGLMFTEGPLWCGEKLLFCDLAASTIYTITPGKDTTPQVYRAETDQAAGAAFDPQGRLLVTHMKGGKVTRTSAEGSIETLVDTVDGQKLARCNDVIVRKDGTVYATDFGGGESRALVKIAPDGKSTICKTTVKTSNGLAFSPDEKVLYLADYGANKVHALDVAANGDLSNEHLLVDLSQEKDRGTPDGMKVDTEGNLYTTGPGGIWVISPKGEKLARLNMKGASNLAFGGPDNKTLFITAGRSVFSVRAKHAGNIAIKPGKLPAVAPAPKPETPAKSN